MLTRGQKTGIAYWAGYIVCIVLYFYFHNIDRYRAMEKVPGVVVERLWGTSHGFRGGRYYRYPQVQFTYKDSSYLFGQSGGIVGGYGIGKKVTVMFPPGRPDDAAIYSFLPFWVSLTTLFFGFMISLFAFCMVVFGGWYKDFKRESRNRA